MPRILTPGNPWTDPLTRPVYGSVGHAEYDWRILRAVPVTDEASIGKFLLFPCFLFCCHVFLLFFICLIRFRCKYGFAALEGRREKSSRLLPMSAHGKEKGPGDNPRALVGEMFCILCFRSPKACIAETPDVGIPVKIVWEVCRHLILEFLFKLPIGIIRPSLKRQW